MKNTIIFTGDTFLKRKNDEKFSFSSSIKTLFEEAYTVCVNLETVLCSQGEKIEKAFNIFTNPDAVCELNDSNVGIVNLANNHTYDFGHKGLESTMNVLQKESLSFIGLKSANGTVVELENGIKVGLLGYTNYYGHELAKINTEIISQDIQILKAKCKYVVVCIHWGEEYVAFPNPYHQRISHKIIDAGASIIISHHPHVMQGVEYYNGGEIYYSLGNFNFFVNHPYAVSLIDTRYAYCVSVDFSDEGYKSVIIPVFINKEWIPEVIDDPVCKSKVLKYIKDISKPLSKDITYRFFYSQAAIHHFKNNMPAWKMRIKKYGIKHFMQMLVWLIRPGTIKYYCGLAISPFRKKYELKNYLTDKEDER